MSALLLMLSVLGLAGQTFFNKLYGKKCKGGGLIFTAGMSFFALIPFLLTLNGMTLSAKITPFSLMFSAAQGITVLFQLLALKYGSMGRTALVQSFSLLIPAVYGICFLGDSVGMTLILGLILLAFSLYLVNYQAEKTKLSGKWLLFVLISFFGNGMCSIIQKEEQLRLGNADTSVFMALALAITTVIFSVLSFVGEKGEAVTAIKSGWYFMAAVGLLNGIVNWMVIFLNRSVQASVLFPVLSAGSLIVSFLLSCVVFREKYTKKQLFGFVIGVAAVILLNLPS